MKKFFLSSLFLKVVLFFLVLAPSSMARSDSYSNMGCYELWYARNAISAAKGYCFTKQKSINAFGKRCYPPYGELSRWETDESNNIRYWERRNGCTNRAKRRHRTYNNRYARVTGIRWDDTLAVRSGPSTSYRRVGNLPHDAIDVRILECRKGWCNIQYGNTVGWSYNKYLRSY